MSSLKRINLFKNENVAQGQARRAGEVQQPAISVQDIQVFRMIEIDMFFFFFGSETAAEGQSYSYLYRTKNLEIQERYSQHH